MRSLWSGCGRGRWWAGRRRRPSSRAPHSDSRSKESEKNNVCLTGQKIIRIGSLYFFVWSVAFIPSTFIWLRTIHNNESYDNRL
jgi:hypothetical protein